MRQRERFVRSAPFICEVDFNGQRPLLHKIKKAKVRVAS